MDMYTYYFSCTLFIITVISVYLFWYIRLSICVANKLVANELVANKLVANELVANKLVANKLVANELAVESTLFPHWNTYYTLVPHHAANTTIKLTTLLSIRCSSDPYKACENTEALMLPVITT